MTRTERHHFWQQTLTDWAASGLSGATFCKEHSLTYHQFVYGRQKLHGPREPAGRGHEPALPGWWR